MNDFDKIKEVFSKKEVSWGGFDEARFKDFLTESAGGLTLGNFRDAFYEALGRQTEENEDSKIIELHGQYLSHHNKPS